MHAPSPLYGNLGLKIVHGPKEEAPCECINCRSQFLGMDLQNFDKYRYNSVVTPAAARTSLAKFVTQINIDKAYLAELCDKHGNTISSRWRKKSRVKREKLLLLADPTFEKEPWFRLRIEGEVDTWQKMRERRRSSLLPYLSTAILRANPSVLLGLLHHRVFRSSEEWAPFDNQQLRQAWALGYFDLEYCGKYCVVMHGVNYGKLVPWSKEAAERLDIVGYPRALLVVEAQALMFSRLRAVIDLILEGTDHSIAGASDKWQEMMRAGSKQPNSIELWSDYVNQPFSAPPKFDVDHYYSIAEARMQAAQDHLWLLQTDPRYFRRFIKVLAVGEVYRTAWRHLFIANDFRLAVEDYLIWRGLYADWSCVRDLHRRFQDSIYPGQPLPRRLESRLVILDCVLLARAGIRVKYLIGYLAQRPGFQHLWNWTPSPTLSESGQPMIYADRKTQQRPAYQHYREDALDYILTQLQCRPNDDGRFDHSELFARLEYHLSEASSGERARLDEIVYAKMSDFAALHEMLAALRLYRPAFTRPSGEEFGKTIEENLTPSTKLFTYDPHKYKPSLHAFPGEGIKLFEQLAPATGRKNESWLDHRTAERKAITEFWDGARLGLRQELSFTRLEPGEIDTALEALSVSSSIEYAEIVEHERLQVSDAIAATAALTKSTTSVTTEGNLWDTSPDVSTLTIEERMVKPKTRPLQPVSAASNQAAPLEPDFDKKVDGINQQQISATARALEVIRKMYPTSIEETLARDTDWDLFVHAMNDLDFNARNVGGSAVAFEHPSKKKIIFHRPHPVAKIDSVMLQSMGKRLGKHFGWSRETFVGV